MIIFGNPSRFAIESDISKIYSTRSLMALGYFVIYVCGMMYGVKKSDATALACSYHEVLRRLQQRNSHKLPSSHHMNCLELAMKLHDMEYGDHEVELLDSCTETDADLRKALHANHVLWAPDGDEAFDDGSFVLHIDTDSEVRLIAYRVMESKYEVDKQSVSEIYMPAEEFYSILSQWTEAFRALVDAQE